MIKNIIFSLVIAMFFSSSVIAQKSSNIAVQKSIEGTFTLAANPVAPVPAAASLDSVEVLEFFSISCIHCYNFSKGKGAFLEQFGDKVDYSAYDIGWLGDNVAKFNFLAEANDKGFAAQELLFSTYHEDGIKDLDNPELLRMVATQLEFDRDYDAHINAPEITSELLKSKSLASQLGVKSTPTFIVEGSIIVAGNNVQNLTTVVNSLLKEPIK